MSRTSLATPPSRATQPTEVTVSRPEMSVELSANALTVLRKRYLIRDASGTPVEEPADLFWRVACHVALVEARYGSSQDEVNANAVAFYRMMVGRYWEPNTPTLINAGRPLGQLSACFVLPVEDELSNGESGIYDTLKAMAMVHQSGGGTGFSFSRLRQTGAMVRSTTGVASGPVSFMSLYDASTDVVKQGGARRGANMGILRVDHPDIEMFIDAKADTTKLVNFNISVAITKAFMLAVEGDTTYTLRDPRTGEAAGERRAREIFHKIVQNAWATGEPGVFFIDEANHYNPVPHLGAYEATNPCGEQPLLPFDVCNLGSINLGRFVRPGHVSEWRHRIDWDSLAAYTRLSTRFLDNIIDANAYPLPQIEARAQAIRRIGNGIMGWADMLVQLGIPYDSPEAVEAADMVAGFWYEACLEASEELAMERGTFPEWERSIWGPDATCARDADGERIRPERRLRNCNVNTVAPTGSISMIADCSAGIEPLFAVAFMRNQAGVQMPDVNGTFVAVAEAEGWYSDELMHRIATTGHIHHPEVPEHVQRIFRTAHDIAPRAHVEMQAAWQRHVDSAISKTTNFPNTATPEQVEEIYRLAFALRCKGITVYRDGSRSGQVLSTGATTTQAATPAVSDEAAAVDRAALAELQGLLSTQEAAILRLEEEVLTKQREIAELELRASQGRSRVLRDRPNILRGVTACVPTGLGKLYVTANFDEAGQLFEMFAQLGKAGSEASAMLQALMRMVSASLRAGVPASAIHHQLRGITSDQAVGFGDKRVRSVPDAVAQAMAEILAGKEAVQQDLPFVVAPVALSPARDVDAHLRGTACPECGAPLERGSGCEICRSCGYSKCG